jgi:hypothetical protein
MLSVAQQVPLHTMLSSWVLALRSQHNMTLKVITHFQARTLTRSTRRHARSSTRSRPHAHMHMLTPVTTLATPMPCIYQHVAGWSVQPARCECHLSCRQTPSRRPTVPSASALHRQIRFSSPPHDLQRHFHHINDVVMIMTNNPKCNGDVCE